MPSRVEIDDRAFMAGLRIALARIDANADRELREGGEDVARDYQQGVGVDTSELFDHIKVQGPVQRRGDEKFIEVGVVGVDHAAVHEFGSPPHVIRSRGPWPLRNPKTGQVFGPQVHHPGTAPNGSFRRALLNAYLTWRPRLLP